MDDNNQEPDGPEDQPLVIHESHLADPMGEDPIEYEGTYLRYRGRYDPEMTPKRRRRTGTQTGTI